jgi:uncharacterized membrane protein YidH (DUF202 family)
MRAILLLLIVLVFIYGAYEAMQLIKRKIDPRKSGKNLLLYFALHLLVIFTCSFLAGLIIMRFRYFFLTK